MPKKKKLRCERKLIVIKIREIVRENKGRDKFERELVERFFFLNLFIYFEGMRDEIRLVWIMIKVELMRSFEVSGKLEIRKWSR